MKWGLTFGIGLLALAGSAITASAADIPARPVYKAAPPPAAVVFDWTGFYVGVNAGGAWGRSNTASPLANSGCGQCYIPSVVTDINAQSLRTLNATAFTGGVQAGYNVQVGNWVLGVEADVNSFRLTASSIVTAAFTFFPGPGALPTYTDTIATNWLVTARGRTGFAFGNTFVYATGGVAFTDLKYTHTFVEGTFPGTSLGVESSTASAKKLGYVVGGGFEYAWSRNWSFKAEYLYLNFGSVSSTASVIFPGGPGGSFFTHTANLTANIARVGINYRF